MKKILLMGSLLLSPLLASAAPEIIEDVFDPANSLLRLPQVKVSDTDYVYDVKLKFVGNNTFKLESFSPTPPSERPKP